MLDSFPIIKRIKILPVKKRIVTWILLIPSIIIFLFGLILGPAGVGEVGPGSFVVGLIVSGIGFLISLPSLLLLKGGKLASWVAIIYIATGLIISFGVLFAHLNAVSIGEENEIDYALIIFSSLIIILYLLSLILLILDQLNELINLNLKETIIISLVFLSFIFISVLLYFFA